MADQTAPGEGQQPSQNQYHQLSPDPLPSDLTPSAAMKTYHLYYTPSMTNLKLLLGSSSGPCTYFMESSILTRKPQIQLRHGDSKSCPMVAFARLQTTSRHMLLGSGDYQKDPEERLVWEELHRAKHVMRRSDYEFGTSIGSGIGSGPRRTYSWKKDMEKVSATVYACVDESGEVVARMLSGGAFNWDKGGEIKVAEGLEKGLEELLLVSALALWAAEALMSRSIKKGYE